MSFSTKVARTMEATSTFSLRLVRGASVWEDTRYLITTRSFASDAPNNAVVDRLTGMVWRRCLGTTVWNGSQCTGTLATGSHKEVLMTQVPELWRIPNIKELGTLLNEFGNYPSYDHFPQLRPGVVGVLWSSTPDVSFRWSAMRVAFVLGGENVVPAQRESPTPILFVYEN